MPLAELLPWRSFTLETSWPPDVVAAELRKRIGDRRVLGGTPEPFEGEWRSELQAVFSNSQSRRSRSSSLPVVQVTIEPSHHNGSRLVVKIRLHVVAALWASLWIIGGAIALLVATVAAMGEHRAAPLVFWMIPIVGIVVWGGSFAYNARKTTRVLAEMIAPAPAAPAPVDTGVPFR